MTKTQKVIDLMLAKGYVEVTAQQRTRKYRVFSHLCAGDRLVFIGKAAAVRFGRTSTTSISIDYDRFVRTLEARP